jgi:hypothetical protein
MSLAKVERYGNGKCMLTGEQTEGVEVRFQDGSLKGFVSWGQFQKLLKARGENGTPSPQLELPMAPRNPHTPP